MEPEGTDTGHPSKKPQDAHYVVIQTPFVWGGRLDDWPLDGADMVEAWLRIAAGKTDDVIATVVKAVYTRGNVNYIIVALDPSVEVQMILGMHEWSNIVTENSKQNLSRQFLLAKSYIYPYDWVQNGDPENKGWEKHIIHGHYSPLSQDVQLKTPYPRGLWCEMPTMDVALCSLILPLPKTGMPHRMDPPPLPSQRMATVPKAAKKTIGRKTSASEGMKGKGKKRARPSHSPQKYSPPSTRVRYTDYGEGRISSYLIWKPGKTPKSDGGTIDFAGPSHANSPTVNQSGPSTSKEDLTRQFQANSDALLEAYASMLSENAALRDISPVLNILDEPPFPLLRLRTSADRKDGGREPILEANEVEEQSHSYNEDDDTDDLYI